ncbi:MAG: MtaA/CmuA family methyltransferase [Candidatus Methylomirabilales bacterium]
MNPLDRFLRVLAQQPVDRPPVVGVTNVVTVELMRSVGTRWPDAHHDPEQMARAGAAAHEVCGLESVKVPFDMAVEASALGADIDYGGEMALPRLRAPLYADPQQLNPPADFAGRGRVPVVLEAIRIARKRYGDRVPVISSALGPTTICGCLFGVENFLVWMIEEPAKAHAAMRRATAMVAGYVREQLRAGAHVAQIGEPTASGDMISPAQYVEFVKRYHQQLAAITDGPVMTHICGNITRHLPHLAEVGFRAVSFDAKTDAAAARAALKGRSALVGYVPTLLLLQGSAREVRQAARRCVESGVDAVNAGCAIAPDTPIKNIRAMVDGVRAGATGEGGGA